MPDECTVAFAGRFPIPGGAGSIAAAGAGWLLSFALAVNQSVLQQVRQLVGLMERAGDSMDAPAVANCEILFMQLLVLLRRSSLMEGATNNDAKLNQLMAWLEDHFAEEVCWEAVAEQFSLSLRTLHRQLKQHTG
ncbi:L-rhamnose operon regulatory protein [Salmonella enterica subsp. enterica]|uniref:L-rhamnose operon regulatory protein n=1 Tax=Salmonella enterica I TaxID=59201 RepID=A0A3S5DDJ4_SALET|nr:L-rhamnose operon regulatory protein [Salmonella enterica subsp. enterica]